MLLTLKQKLELPITEIFQKGESVKKLANDYGIGFQTVRDTKKNKEKLIEFTRNYQFNDWCGEWREQQGRRDMVT